MNGATIELAAARLKAKFVDATRSGRLGGAQVLGELASLASECCSASDDARACVAIALWTVLGFYADDKRERPVGMDENQEFYDRCHAAISDAIEFIRSGGTSDAAVEIAGRLARSVK